MQRHLWTKFGTHFFCSVWWLDNDYWSALWVLPLHSHILLCTNIFYIIFFQKKLKKITHAAPSLGQILKLTLHRKLLVAWEWLLECLVSTTVVLLQLHSHILLCTEYLGIFWVVWGCYSMKTSAVKVGHCFFSITTFGNNSNDTWRASQIHLIFLSAET